MIFVSFTEITEIVFNGSRQESTKKERIYDVSEECF